MQNSITCGVVITDGEQILICHPTNGNYWDLPKGKQDPGETNMETAIRELREETGLHARPVDLLALGTHDYKATKQLGLFLWHVDQMPEPDTLSCDSKFNHDGHDIPEMDGYAVVDYQEALNRVNPDMRRVLSKILD